MGYFLINKPLNDLNPFVIILWDGISGFIILPIAMGIFETPMFLSSGLCQGFGVAERQILLAGDVYCSRKSRDSLG